MPLTGNSKPQQKDGAIHADPANRTGSDEPWAWTATATIQAIRKREVTPSQVLDSVLQRIDRVNPTINAFVEVYRDEAASAAKAFDGIVRAGGSSGPFSGIPVALKDNTYEAGKHATDGVEALKDFIYPHDDPIVERIRESGGVVIGRTNVPPHCVQLFCTNTLFGETLNPRNPDLTPGGSSGGAAAALASGMIHIAQGNDIGGSIRYPAYACGVVGLRSTVGTIAGSDPRPLMVKPFPFQIFAVQGALARTVEDEELAFRALRGYSPRCAFSTPPIDLPLGARRVGVYLGEEIVPLDPQVRQAVEIASRALERAGYVVEPIRTSVFEQARTIAHQLIFEHVMRLFPNQVEEGGEILRRGVIGAQLLSERLLGRNFRLTFDGYTDALALRGQLIVELQELLERYPVILTPVSSEPPFARNEDQEASDARRERMADVIWPMESVVPLAVPAISVPTGHWYRGVPLGVQLIARRFAENDLFQAARIVEATVQDGQF